MTFPPHVRLVEVGPRDGLQNEPGDIATQTKIELIERLIAAGLRTIEVGSFVSPKWVPQMADTPEVLRALRPVEGAHYLTLVPNMKGLELARAAGARDIAVFAAASETFTRRNINSTIEESLARYAEVCAAALASGMRVRGYVSTVIGCPYEGDIAPSQVAAVAKRLSGMGCYEVSLGDTIGVGTPGRVHAMLDAVLSELPLEQVAVHFHDTYGQALANIYASLERGVATIDSSVGGLGGCPYARGASGNVATEDVLYLLKGLGIETGVNLDALVQTGAFICAALGRDNQSKAGKALLAKAQ